MWNSSQFFVFWRRGGNWAAFLLFWFVASAIISTLEHTWESIQLTGEEQSKVDITAITSFLKTRKNDLESDTALANQLDQIINIMDTNPDMARLWSEMDLEIALVQHKMVKTVVEIVKDEFARVESNLNENDKMGKILANKFIKLLSEENTVNVFRNSGEKHMKESVAKEKENQKKCSEKKAAGQSCREEWSFGNALHFTSTVFTTTGYGAHTTMTTVVSVHFTSEVK